MYSGVHVCGCVRVHVTITEVLIQIKIGVLIIEKGVGCDYQLKMKG